MAQIDAALKVHVIRCHILQANLIVQAVSWSPHCGHDVSSRPDRIRHIRADLDYPAEVFMTGNEELLSLRRVAVFRGIDFLVRAINAYPQHLHKYTLPIWNIRY